MSGVCEMTTRFTEARSCEGKKRYGEHHAERAAKRLREKGEHVLKYACKYCGSWHVGHNNRVR